MILNGEPLRILNYALVRMDGYEAVRLVYTFGRMWLYLMNDKTCPGSSDMIRMLLGNSTGKH
jgi:hypothetical protein